MSFGFRSCRRAALLQCDYCPLLFHLDCLNPPMTTMPTGRWMCPNHPENFMVRSLNLLPMLMILVTPLEILKNSCETWILTGELRRGRNFFGTMSLRRKAGKPRVLRVREQRVRHLRWDAQGGGEPPPFSGRWLGVVVPTWTGKRDNQRCNSYRGLPSSLCQTRPGTNSPPAKSC